MNYELLQKFLRDFLALFVLGILPANGFSQEITSDFEDDIYTFMSNSVYEKYPVSTAFMPLIFDGKFAFPLDKPLPADTFSLSVANNNTQSFSEELWDRLRIGARNVMTPGDDFTLTLTKETAMITEWRKRAQHAALWCNNLPAAHYVMSDLPDVEEDRLLSAPSLRDIFSVDYERTKRTFDNSAKFVPHRLYWTKNGSSLLQFSQNYISENWYNGGVGNLNMQSVQTYTANYKKGKIQFNNFLEWKLSLYTNPNDTLRNTRLGEDLVRYYGDFGLKANNHWLYSMNLEIKTRLFRAYKENSNERIGSIFSPLNINMGVLGMKYQFENKSKTDKYKKTTISADISPLAVQYTWVADKLVDPTRYGIEENEHYLIVLGSSLNAKAVIQFNWQITFSSRLKYFSNFEQILVESENELNMALSRFLSTRIYLYGRFDDSNGVKRDPDLDYIQLNEIFSFGFNYKF
ncbi:hypothetical protein AGMMS49525_03790 [Bacteroidia bacterium]|nr:hypothetical protein AGMMS49525_03790 [Bacteroidia bacterium]